MAVVKVVEKWSGRSGNIDDKYRRDYRRVFQVITNNTYDEAAAIIASPLVNADVPSLWDSYENRDGSFVDNGALCTKITIDQNPEEPTDWTLTCEFSSNVTDETLQNKDPLSRPPDISVDFDQFQEPFDVDLVGQSLVTSAGQKFDPPVMRDDSRPVIVIERNEPTFDYTVAANYKDAINSDIVLGFQPLTLKLRMGARRAYENGVIFWRVRYQLSYKFPDWRFHLIDQGTMQLDAARKLKNCVDFFNHAVTSPVLLDGNGHQLINPTVAAPNPLPNAVELPEFIGYNELPFAVFHLP